MKDIVMTSLAMVFVGIIAIVGFIFYTRTGNYDFAAVYLFDSVILLSLCVVGLIASKKI